MNTLAPQILLVEDTPDISLWLGTALRQGGMAVSFATDGVQADRCLQAGHGFDAVLLDLQLPGRDGLSVLQALRERGDAVPVLILTARASVPDRVLGLNMGADDYLPKPFDLSELEARLQALLRRPGRVKTAVLRCGPLALDLESGAVQLHGQPFPLTKRETAALRVLLESPRLRVRQRGVFALEVEAPALVLFAGPGGADVFAQAFDLFDQVADGVGDFPPGPEDAGKGAEGGDSGEAGLGLAGSAGNATPIRHSLHLPDPDPGRLHVDEQHDADARRKQLVLDPQREPQGRTHHAKGADACESDNL